MESKLPKLVGLYSGVVTAAAVVIILTHVILLKFGINSQSISGLLSLVFMLATFTVIPIGILGGVTGLVLNRKVYNNTNMNWSMIALASGIICLLGIGLFIELALYGPV